MRSSDWRSDVCSSDLLAIGPPFLIEEPRDLVPAPAQRDTDASWRGVAASLSPLSALLVYDIVAMATRLIGVTPPRFVAELLFIAAKRGRASCRERVCQYV